MYPLYGVTMATKIRVSFFCNFAVYGKKLLKSILSAIFSRQLVFEVFLIDQDIIRTEFILIGRFACTV